MIEMRNKLIIFAMDKTNDCFIEFLYCLSDIRNLFI